MIKVTARSIRLETVDGVQYVDITYENGEVLRMKGPRDGMKVNERREGDRCVLELEFEKPFAAQAEAGNVKLLREPCNERWLNHMHGQPEISHDDEMHAASGAFNDLTAKKGRVFNF